MIFEANSQPMIMGILNLTPDSFSDGGAYPSTEAALQRCRQMIREGASIIDVGGESSRPGSTSISEQEELRRILPVIKALRAESDILISVDTYKSRVAYECAKLGVDMINDISGGLYDPSILELAASFDLPIILMHNRYHETPHARSESPAYKKLIADVRYELELLVELAAQKSCKKIIIDPGFGFAKQPQDNLELLAHLQELDFGYPILIGASNKRFIRSSIEEFEKIRSEHRPETELDGHSPDPLQSYLGANITVSSLAVLYGASIIRSHEVAQHYQGAMMAYSIRRQMLQQQQN